MAEQEVTIQYNLCNEPWLKYSMAAVADRGLRPAQWTSARLHSEARLLPPHVARVPPSCSLLYVSTYGAILVLALDVIDAQ